MNTKALEDKTLNSLANQYRKNGFEVIVEPSHEDMPFRLDNYRPDLLASRQNLNLMIEIKNSLKRVSMEHLQAVSEKVSAHQDWRLILVTLDDVQEEKLPGTESNYPNWDEIDRQADKASELIETVGLSAALVYVWTLVEATLRRYAFETSVPVERLPLPRIVKHLYSIGVLSMDKQETLISLQNIRNQAAHGLNIEISREKLEQLVRFIHKSVSSFKIAI